MLQADKKMEVTVGLEPAQIGFAGRDCIQFMKECGVDPGLSPALRSLMELASKKQ